MRLTRSQTPIELAGTGAKSWVLAALIAALCGSRGAAQTGAYPGQYRPAAQPTPQPGLQYDQRIQLTQRVTARDSKPKRPLPYEIQEMPDIQEEMEVIHRRSQLMITRAPIARIAIADPTTIDVVQYSPTEVGILGLALGSTTLTLWFDGTPEPLIYLVEVIPDPTYEDRLEMDFGKLEKQLHILFPNSKVYLIPLQQRLVVKGQARDPEEAAHILQIVRSAYFAEFGLNNRANGNGNFGGNGNNNNNNTGDDDDDDDFIVNLLEVPGNHQIMLHVKVAEVSRSQLRRLGVDLEWMLNDGRHVLTSNLAGAAATLTGIFENNEVDVMVNWLAGNRTAKVLAAPTLTVLSGHTASFLSGGEFPVPTIVGVGGAQGTSTSFRGFGTSLLVRPEVIDKDWVQLDITPEYSQISSNGGGGGGGGVPSLRTRRVSTTVRLREGQTIVLAGLYGSTMTTEVDRIPFFGELPIIGPAIFNAKQADQGQNELLIIVTPELVRPMEPDEVPPLPGFEVTAPNDIELYAYAKTEGYPDQGVYQLNPFGWGPGYASEVGYRPFNPAPAGGQFGMGGGMMGGGYQVASPGYMVQPQPTNMFPGPPMQQQPMMAPQQPPAMMPQGAGAMQPIPDQNMTMMGQGGGAIQQVNYEQPAPQRGSFMNWLRRQPAQNPALRPTNSTTPSLQNGNDGRLGRGGTFRPQQPQNQRQQYYGQPMQRSR